MRDYFRHTTAVSNIAAWFAQNSRPGSRTARVLEALCSHRVENDFRVGPTQIAATTSGLEKFRRGLEEILRLADLANLYGKRIAHRTCEAIRDSVAELPDTLSRPAAERFLSLMSQPLKLGPLLRTLHELGVLEKIIPAFVHARCLLQFNQYHKFTVDEHCLRAVEIATEFWHDPGPLGRAYRGLKSKRVLHLALLLHDLGKGYPEDHSEVGLRIADETAARLRLPEDEADALRFLVHKHLMLSHLAFRRDTSDERVIIRLAFDVGSPERLTMLYLLTAADLNAVGPGVLNSWKVDVLTSLYDRTMHHLSGDADAARTEDRLRALRQDVWAALGDVDDRPWFEDQVQALPTGYLMAHGPVEVAQELRELHTLPPGALVAQARYQGENNTVQYKVGTHEDITPGVFHKLTGALTGAGLEILSAEIHTLARGLIVDRFVVVDPDYAGEPPPERIEAVLAALHSAVRNPGPPVFRKTWGTRRGSQPIDLAPLPTQVRIDNNTSDEFTIIDVFTTDRTGLLYAITKTLFDLGLSVSLAKIGTFLDQVVDVFYVTDRNGQKIHNPERLDAIREALLREIEVPEPQAAHGTSS
jgi:[protein-PII] uridylyltransferase